MGFGKNKLEIKSRKGKKENSDYSPQKTFDFIQNIEILNNISYFVIEINRLFTFDPRVSDERCVSMEIETTPTAVRTKK